MYGRLISGKKRRIVLFVGILVIFIILAVVFGMRTNLKDKIWLYQHVNLVDDNEQTGIKVIRNEKEVSYLNLNYQQTVTKKIKQAVKKHSYSFKQPLLVLNPYGTNFCGINVYFETDEDAYLSYTVSVDSGAYPDFTRILENGEKDHITKKHNYQLLGLVPGEQNHVKMVLYNAKNEQIGESAFTVNMPKLDTEVDIQIEYTDGNSTNQLTDGLYTLFGNSKNFKADLYMYDNNGVLRSDIPVKDYRSDRILFIDDCLVYSYDDNKIAKVDRLGQIVEKYIFSGYELHHDFAYDEINNKIVMLATKLKQETSEDIILQLDLKTGQTSECIDFKNILPENYEKAEKPEDKKVLDWIHFNSIQIIGGKDLILSARELSSIVKVENIYEEPTLSYLLADETMWKGTAYEDFAFQKIGDFTAQAGQHTVTYAEDSTLPQGQYYLYMYNNNLAFSGTRTDFDWSAYKGAGTHKNPTDSYYYKYLVDENAKSFELIDSFAVPYSSYVSSAQDMEENYVVCSGLVPVFGEYDNEGKLIRQFDLQNNVYRVFKYNFNGLYFYKQENPSS